MIELPSVKISKILYATDLSESARLAFAYAVSLARRYDAGITIMHVLYEDLDLDQAIVGYVDADVWDGIKTRNMEMAREALLGKKRDNVAIHEALGKWVQDVEANSEKRMPAMDEIIVDRGNPVERILARAEERQCDLIVMGSRGHGTLHDVMLGSNVQRVVRRSKVPVLVVRLPKEED